MFEKIKCNNCKYYDDIMFMEECHGCSLSKSKPEETIKFEEKE